MSKPDLIALSGYARSGKDTVAEYLVKEHGYTRVAFADALRDALYALNPIVGVKNGRPVVLQEVVDELGWEGVKAHPVYGPEFRALQQRMGTEVGRDIIGPNVWVDIAMRKVAAVDGPVVITDLRFPNEYAAVWEEIGDLWRIERSGTAPVNAHPSETALDGHAFDVCIFNTGTIEKLHQFVEDEITQQ